MWILIGLLEDYFSASHWKGVLSLVLGWTLPPYQFSQSEFPWSQLWWQNNRITCTCSNIIWCIFHTLLWHSHAGELCMVTSSTSVQFSCSVMSDYLRPHELLQARLPCPSPTFEPCSDSCLSSWWCHPINSSSVIPFSSCPQSFPASGSFPMSQFFTSGGQSIRVSALASIVPMNIQDWFPLGWNGWISLQSKGLSRVFSSTTIQKHQFFSTQLSL